MAHARGIRRVIRSTPTIEGAGVHLKRVFGFSEVEAYDPFLLLDDFRSDDPEKYLQGFPWHPHRGIETITYILHGSVEHKDSLGNAGVIGPGDVQWMTAGSGIIHQEMPKGDDRGMMGGFQLWANLPAKAKMMEPRYRDVQSSQIPLLTFPNGVTIRIVAGALESVAGPVEDVMIHPEYLDVSVPPETEYRHPTHQGHNVLAYLFGGEARFGTRGDHRVPEGHLVLFEDGEEVVLQTGQSPARFLLISGSMLREPIAWYGPIVMNTKEELQEAVEDYQRGTFIRHKQVR